MKSGENPRIGEAPSVQYVYGRTDYEWKFKIVEHRFKGEQPEMPSCW